MSLSRLFPSSRSLRRLASAALLLAALAVQPDARAASLAEATPDPASDIFHLTSRQFEEPFLPTAPTSADEDAALRQAIARYEARATEDDFSALTGYLDAYSHSGWRVAVLTDLGLLQYHYGYFSRAIASFGAAWQEGRSATDPKVHMLVDRAVGELAEMHARLGHVPELQALFKDIGNRPITGPATERLQGAREGLSTMETDPGVSFLCGPMALKSLLLSSGYKYDQVAFLDAFRSGPHGVSLQEVSDLASKAGLAHRVIHRTAGQPIPVPSIIHWRVSHFAAIVGQQGSRFHMIDPTFGTDLWITKAAIEAEGDGFFLVPESNRAYAWQLASLREQKTTIGMGDPYNDDPTATTPCDKKVGGKQGCGGQSGSQGGGQSQSTTPQAATVQSPGMAAYSFTEIAVNLNITDTPVGYAPPKGPDAHTTITYNQREVDQPAVFSFFNVSPKWTVNWLSYIQDDPRYPGATVTRYVAGGGYVPYSGYNGTTGAFTPDPRDASVLLRSTTGAIVYTRTLSDGSIETYAASNGATTYPRLVFMTQLTDPQGNSIAFTYDSQQRLTSVTDATGRVTTFSYELSASPLLVTKITDPFGRSALLSYDSTGRLSQITDVLGLQSKFIYDSASPSSIDAMTTPYGTTTFTSGGAGTYRYVSATDPLGQTERLEWNAPAPASSNLPFSEPKVPTGIINPFNAYINYRDTFYWDKHAYAVAAGNYSLAHIDHWMHLNSDSNYMYHAVESYKNPFENRVWFNYPNQSSTGFSGSLDFPTRIGRILDDGTTQLTQMTYNTLGQLTDMIDPVGRETQFSYATNGIDLTGVKQKTSSSGYSTLATLAYNGQHLPLTTTEAAGQTTTYTYNSAGQPLTVTDALGNKTTFNYDGQGYLQNIVNANNQTQASFTYDMEGRVATRTDSEGYTVAYQYDAFDRPTLETYPDGTTRQYAYNRLDLASVTDRQGRTTGYAYDANRQLTQITDPLSRKTKFGYFENGTRKSLTDPNGNTTSWAIDVQNRVTGKTYADGKGTTNAYEATTSRLHSVTDALAQVKQYSYTEDDQLAGITYSHAVNPTPNVGWAYDPYFVRPESMTDGSGMTNYTYQPVGALGALQLAQEAGPYSNSTIGYAYDQLGRLAVRSVAGSAETFSYDALNRLTVQANALGTFDLGYLGQTGQLTSQQARGGVVGTRWTYDSNTNDRRLKAITNSGATRNYQFMTTPENLISQISEIANPGSAFPSQTWNYSYDDSDRLLGGTSSLGKTYGYGYDPADNILSQQTPTGSTTHNYNDLNQIASDSYDANGNLLDDGQRTYTWDAENRLLSVTSKTQAGKTTSFRYDGLDRRIAIVTNGTEMRYLWCGEQLCHARSAANVVTRRYFDQGEFIPAGETELYYAQDQLGSVRDVVAVQNGSRVASYDYEPYGNPSQTAGRVGTDFRFAGMFYEPNSGIALTTFRGFDPQSGRWIVRDPMREAGGVNLYNYAASDPTNIIDLLGLCPPKAVNCNSLLPNGKTIGDVVRSERAALQEVEDAQMALLKAGVQVQPLAALSGAFLGIVLPHGPIDFKLLFKGADDPAYLGRAGNFAYYAIGSGYLPDTELDLGAGAYAVWAGKPISTLTGPGFSDKSAASVRDAALASQGCPK